jgi:hypothetical protein
MDQCIDPAKVRQRQPRQPLDFADAAQIGGDGQRLRAAPRKLGRQRLKWAGRSRG